MSGGGAGRDWTRAAPGLFVVLWATGFIGAKYGLPYAGPATFLAVRFVLVIALMLAIAVAGRAPWPVPRQAAHIAVVGVLLQAGYLGGVFAAIHLGMSAGVSSLIVGLQPVLTAVLAAPMVGERLGIRQWAGLVLGLAGVALVVSAKTSLAGLSWASVGMSVLALASITLGTLYQKRFCGPFDLRTGSVIQFVAALAVMAPFAVFLEGAEVRWTGEFLFALAWLVVVLSIGAISLLMLLIRRGAATKVASLFYLVPPVTALIAYLVFGETLSAAALAGMAIAVIGVAMVVRG
ncbi:MAG: DMT family transporter [Burkholderiales bacterium]|nr:DMT family transporter [Burkholderiales bacterium]